MIRLDSCLSRDLTRQPEVGLVGITAVEASKGLPIWSDLVFSAIFAAEMSHVDTTENILLLELTAGLSLSPSKRFITT